MMEKILCAAINYTNHEQSNGQRGLIICGHRHNNCIHTYFELTNKPTRKPYDIQGFLTSTGRFVDRIEGGKIAFYASQIATLIQPLFSESLY